LITGPTAGIGRAFAEQLAARGHDLIAVARDGERLAALAASLEQQYGVRVTTLVADLSHPTGIEATAAAIRASGRLALLVNNAGFGTRGVLHATDMSAQHAMLALHVLAVNAVTRAALDVMVPAKRGGVITVASVASFVNGTGNANYCATKAYQRSLMEGIAMEVAPDGIAVQALCPGFTRSEFHERMRDGARLESRDKWWWMSADDVVSASLAALDRGGPIVVVPGWQYKAAVFLARHIPLRIKQRLTQRAYRRD
jgi:uncharacterized protein